MIRKDFKLFFTHFRICNVRGAHTKSQKTLNLCSILLGFPTPLLTFGMNTAALRPTYRVSLSPTWSVSQQFAEFDLIIPPPFDVS
ncbi:hypothetical protein [Tateyamaria sp.]|uniref:hypothetical protein n=1 Tax=Tateyamaria sp. TaxID=1929288 RepID=UPI00329E6088